MEACPQLGEVKAIAIANCSRLIVRKFFSLADAKQWVSKHNGFLKAAKLSVRIHGYHAKTIN